MSDRFINPVNSHSPTKIVNYKYGMT